VVSSPSWSIRPKSSLAQIRTLPNFPYAAGYASGRRTGAREIGEADAAIEVGDAGRADCRGDVPAGSRARGRKF
jgi:hypothetical protein